MVDETPQDWESCPSGELAKIVGRFRHARQDRQRAGLVAAGGVVAGLLLVGVFTFSQWTRPSVNASHPITCSEVKSRLDAYIAGEVTDTMSQRIQSHLSGCPHCDREYERRMAGESGAMLDPPDEQLTLAFP